MGASGRALRDDASGTKPARSDIAASSLLPSSPLLPVTSTRIGRSLGDEAPSTGAPAAIIVSWRGRERARRRTVTQSRRTDALSAVVLAAALLAYALVPAPWLAALAGAAFVTAAFVRPRLGLAAVLATLPTYFHAPDLAGLAFSLPELALLLTTVGVAIRVVVRGDVRPRATRFDGWVALLLAAALLSLLPTEYLKLSLRLLRTLLLEPLL